MSTAILGPIHSESRVTVVADAIRDAIYAGRLQPGQVVRELQLARELRVSQTTVREALLLIEHTGLVTRGPNRGTRVTLLSEKEISERVTVRLVVEVSAAVEAAPRFLETGVTELESRMNAISAAVSRNQYYEAAQADLAFHRLIWQACGNETLYRLLDQLTAPLFAFLSMQRHGDLEDLRHRVRSHKPIVEALRSGRRAAIRAAIRDHLWTSYRQYLKIPPSYGGTQA